MLYICVWYLVFGNSFVSHVFFFRWGTRAKMFPKYVLWDEIFIMNRACMKSYLEKVNKWKQLNTTLNMKSLNVVCHTQHSPTPHTHTYTHINAWNLNLISGEQFRAVKWNKHEHSPICFRKRFQHSLQTPLECKIRISRNG